MNEMSFTRLSKATIEAASDIASLLPQLSSKSRQFTYDDLNDMLCQNRCHIYVAMSATGVSQQIVGMLTIVGYRIPTGEKWQLEDVVLDENLRGKGIARQLLNYALNDFQTQHPTASIHLTSRPSRIAANALYQSLGFKQKITNNYIVEPEAKD